MDAGNAQAGGAGGRGPLQVLVTSGGTACPIDDVRVVTNLGSGLFGSQIAEAFLEEGCRVHYLHSRGALRPFLRRAGVDLDADLDAELERVRALRAEYRRHRDRLHLYAAPTFDDYLREVERLAREQPLDLAVMTMAASDYAPERQRGKIPSETARYTLQMVRTPKVIDRLRALRPDLFLVAFKLSSGLESEELRENARAWMRRGRFDLTVANDLSVRRPPDREVWLLTPRPDTEDQRFTGRDVAPPLVRAILDVLSRRFGPDAAGR